MQAQLNKILEEAKEQLKKASTLAQTNEDQVESPSERTYGECSRDG